MRCVMHAGGRVERCVRAAVQPRSGSLSVHRHTPVGVEVVYGGQEHRIVQPAGFQRHHGGVAIPINGAEVRAVTEGCLTPAVVGPILRSGVRYRP